MSDTMPKESIGERLERYFLGCGYARVDLHSELMSLYYIVRDRSAYLVWMMGDAIVSDISRETYENYHKTIQDNFFKQGFAVVQTLTLCLTSNTAKVKSFAEGTAFWIVDEAYGRLVVYDNQPEDYLGLRGIIEQNLHFGADIRNADGKQKQGVLEEKAPKQSNVRKEKKPKGYYLKFIWFVLCQFKYWITFALVAANVALFFMSNDDILYRFGNEYNMVFHDGEYYRLFTSMFLHLDNEHLTSNMFILLLVGLDLEKRIGHIWYLTGYLVSGLIASLSSCLYHFCMKENAICIGASGAIYGIIGLMVLLLFVEERKEAGITLWIRMGLFLAYMFYGVFTSAGIIDNAAHIGGFLSGTLFAVCYRRISRRRKRKMIQSQ